MTGMYSDNSTIKYDSDDDDELHIVSYLAGVSLQIPAMSPNEKCQEYVDEVIKNENENKTFYQDESEGTLILVISDDEIEGRIQIQLQLEKPRS